MSKDKKNVLIRFIGRPQNWQISQGAGFNLSNAVLVAKTSHKAKFEVKMQTPNLLKA